MLSKHATTSHSEPAGTFPNELPSVSTYEIGVGTNENRSRQTSSAAALRSTRHMMDA